ncbi:Energy-coupling factor transporter transmembrane protein EcfT [Sporotomaculum syntrophicum]|uniref:Energy-coupling factor transporter transmembrane protein EcfT n=1 Tax=Sporotomaculum syntrophicum TaxID=182264 RepID=A0A9D2WMV8_9FIRM|nr:energy-coupling factor transporter transmembrane component T [Sporotomaculum syntrophicum]KAF1083793.1 Energy-coupling factor transporter transmembrane protein EcfT [Sporotomaculum syntrophicum]
MGVKLAVKMINLDPRAKIVIVLCLSTLAVFFNTPGLLLIVLIITLLLLQIFQVKYISLIYKFRRLLPVLFVLLFIQSAFTGHGQVLVAFGDVHILTTGGVSSASCVLLRMLILFGSAMIIATSNSRDYVLALVELKIPYEIAFMVLIALRFLPVFVQEAKDTLIAIQLRGVDMQKVAWGKKIKVFTYIFSPLVSNVLLKANQLAISMEARGFRLYPRRTYLRVLKYNSLDYLITILSLSITLVVLTLSIIR